MNPGVRGVLPGGVEAVVGAHSVVAEETLGPLPPALCNPATQTHVRNHAAHTPPATQTHVRTHNAHTPPATQTHVRTHAASGSTTTLTAGRPLEQTVYKGVKL